MATRECNTWFLAKEEIETGESTIEYIPSTPPEVPIFICRVDGSWKNEDTTSGIGWILHIQDGSIDLLGLQGCHKQISPLHTELKVLVWTLNFLLRHQWYCNYFNGMVHLGPVDTTTSITMIVEVLKHVSKSRATVAILKFGRLEGRYNFFMIVLACGTFVNLFNIVSSFVKLVSLSIYRYVCLMLVLVVVLGL